MYREIKLLFIKVSLEPYLKDTTPAEEDKVRAILFTLMLKLTCFGFTSPKSFPANTFRYFFDGPPQSITFPVFSFVAKC